MANIRLLSIITLLVFTLGLLNISTFNAYAQTTSDVKFTFNNLDEMRLSGEVDFSINVKIAPNSTIDNDYKLRYKAEIKKDGVPLAGQVIQYGENYQPSFTSNSEGIAYFGPEKGFTLGGLSELKSENGITTHFKADLSQGDYYIKVSLIRINENGEEIQELGQGIKIFIVSDVSYKVNNLTDMINPGEIEFSITCKVSNNVRDDINLQHKAVVTKNNLPLRNHEISYKESNQWKIFRTDENGIAYFGPSTGFTLTDLPDLKNTGITTELKTELPIGEYSLTLVLVDLVENEKHEIGVPTKTSFSVQRYPVLSSRNPAINAKGIVNQDLHQRTINGVVRYFIRLSYNLDGDLRFADDGLIRLRNSMIRSSGGSESSIVDYEFLNTVENNSSLINQHIFVKDGNYAHLYIPIKPLRPQAIYEVSISSDIIYYAGGSGNKEVAWYFSTMPIPMVTGVSIGSVGEDYDETVPIYIRGDYFIQTGSVSVKFNDIFAYSVSVEDGHLRVSLPRGNNKLKPGNYNITVINRAGYEQTLFGQFSVIKSAELPAPRDGKRVIYEDRNLQVIQTVKRSEDTVELASRYSNRSYIELDLDNLMGANVRSRKITYEGYRRDRISELRTLSQWADVTLYGVTLNSPDRRDNVEILLCRAPASVTMNLRNSLRNYTVKSDFIEVGGKNYRADRIDLRIPYQNSEGTKLKVLRYDEFLRSWYETPFIVNKIDQNVRVINTQPGIFIVVE